METKIKNTQNAKTAMEDERNLRKVLNIIGLFIFGGMVLTSITKPMPADYFKEYLVFIAGSALVYYFLVNIYSLGQTWRKIFYAIIFMIGVGSMFMVFYLLNHASH